MNWKATMRIFLVLFLVIFPHVAPLPFYSYILVGFVAILVFQRSNGETLADLGLKKHGLTSHALIIGGGTAVIWTAFNQFVYIPLIFKLFTVPEYAEYDFIRNNPINLIITLVAAWVVGGFYEELVFRGFILSSLQRAFRSINTSFILAAILSSILFGLYHLQQGIFGVIPSFAGGLFWSYLLYRYDRNLWYPILSHALYDTIALILIYFKLFGLVRW